MNDGTRRYTVDELDFLDKAMIAIANGLLSDPAVVRSDAAAACKAALALLEERRKLRGTAKHDDEGASRLARLEAFYADAWRLAGFMDGDPKLGHSAMVYEILDGYRKKMQDRVTTATPTAIAVSGFQDELVERLAGKLREELGQEPKFYDWSSCAMIVLAELAKVPAELPTVDEFEAELIEGGATDSQANWFGSLAQNLAHNHYTPLMAAKDARIAELEKRWCALPKALAAIDGDSTEDATQALEMVVECARERDDARKRIAELEHQASVANAPRRGAT
jgi:hypothetical protein